MRSKPLIFLFVLAVVLVGFALQSSRRPETAAPQAIGKLVLPDLPVNDVERVIIVSQGSTSTVVKTDTGWTLAEKHGYPASFERIRNAVIKLSELKIGDQRRVTSETRKDFGVVPPGPSQPDATRVELLGKDGKVLAALLLGKHHLRKGQESSPYGGGDYPDGRYVSTDEGSNVYLVKDPLTEFSAQTLGWMETELLNVDAAEVSRITLTGPDREPLEISKSGTDNALQVSNLAATEESDAAKLSSLHSALAYLNLQDVADPALGDAAMGFDNPDSFTAETPDGRVYKLLIGAKTADGARYLRGHAEFREPTPPPADTNTLADAATTNAPAVSDTSATRATVDALNRKLTSWTFVIPSYKAESMVLTRSELVKPKTTPETDSDSDAMDIPPAPAVVSPPVTTAADTNTPSHEEVP